MRSVRTPGARGRGDDKIRIPDAVKSNGKGAQALYEIMGKRYGGQ
ncbi:hypothetical protein [Streptomyces mirabilis]